MTTGLAAFLALPVGTRVVIRYRTPQGVTDVLGTLLRISAVDCVVRGRRGDVSVAVADIVAGKQIPPPPEPRPRSTLADTPGGGAADQPLPDEGEPAAYSFHAETNTKTVTVT